MPYSPEQSPEYLAQYGGQALVAVSVLFIVVDSVFVALRFYAHRLAHSPLGLDDFIIPFAWLTHVGLCILGILMVDKGGAGRHRAYLMEADPAKLGAWTRSLYALAWLYPISVALPKISVLLLYLRIFAARPIRIISHILIWVLVATMIAYIIASSLECTPFEYVWNKTITGKCFDLAAYWKTSGVPNIFTDLVMILLPLQPLFHLKVPTSIKAGVVLIFLSGGIGILSSCVRMAIFFEKDIFVDDTWAAVKLVSWNITETGMYLVAACSIRLRPVINKLGEKMKIGSTTDSPHRTKLFGSSADRKIELIPINMSLETYNKV